MGKKRESGGQTLKRVFEERNRLLNSAYGTRKEKLVNRGATLKKVFDARKDALNKVYRDRKKLLGYKIPKRLSD